MKIFFILLAVAICQTAWAATTAKDDEKSKDTKHHEQIDVVTTAKNDGKSKDTKHHEQIVTTAKNDGKSKDTKHHEQIDVVTTAKNDGKSKDTKHHEQIESKGNGDNLKVEVINNFYGAQCCEQNKDTKVKTTKLPEGYNLTPNVGAHKYYSDLKVWNDARKFCEHEGAHLAIADSEEEMKILEKLIGTAVDTWVGFHDLFTIGDWVTVLDKPVPFYSWSPGNPDLPNAERCGSMRTNGFNNLNCNSAVGFICEVEISK